jgi:hypothetical protein
MTTQDINDLAQDLHYVREAVQTSRAMQYRSMTIPLLWAAVIAVGFTINDFCRPETVGLYWAIVSPIAGILSGWPGMHVERSTGVQSNKQDGRRIAFHWLTILAGFIAVVIITTSRELDAQLTGQLMTLVFGIVYFLGGLHLDGRFLIPGLAAIFGSAAIGHLGPFSWTIVGAVIACALIASAVWKKGHHVQACLQS